MIGGISAAAVAVILMAILLARGEVGRIGIILAMACGSALGFAATIFAVMFDLLGIVAQVAQNIAGAG
jgi:hypothetical protein